MAAQFGLISLSQSSIYCYLLAITLKQPHFQILKLNKIQSHKKLAHIFRPRRSQHFSNFVASK